ncbi:hypothetical protein AMET1_0549 [Methanonatronarchaeum thermophilum]|uniref:Uncharacterized protein n=1 Tax=Methanonatronarchaeum thermophilum TaxID=1927129 RepID=A0A1Y3GBU8_9EURY|nr:hypothetical protein [Methanonatronarchaeum thermophilum]OUJ18898.1 hypothetical protein AMET1_0549 [Methanonatronarchaeum thermophilum]
MKKYFEIIDELKDVKNRAELEDKVLLLPSEKYEEDYIYESGVFAVQKVLELNNINCELAITREDKKVAVERSAGVEIPSILLFYWFWENKEIIFFILEKIAEYYIQRAHREIEIEVYQETSNGDYKRFSYKGHPKDLPNSLMQKMNKALEDGDSVDE